MGPADVNLPAPIPSSLTTDPAGSDVSTSDESFDLAVPDDTGQSGLSFSNVGSGNTNSSNLFSLYTVPAGKVFIAKSCIVSNAAAQSILVKLVAPSGNEICSAWHVGPGQAQLLNGEATIPAGTLIQIRVPNQGTSLNYSLSFTLTGDTQNPVSPPPTGGATLQKAQVITNPLK